MSKFNNGDVTDVLDSFFIDYAIDDDDDETNIQELMRQRSDMNKAVNEWYAKADAFGHIENLVRTELTSDDLYNDARDNDYAAGMLRVYEMVDYIIDEYESGERNEYQ